MLFCERAWEDNYTIGSSAKCKVQKNDVHQESPALENECLGEGRNHDGMLVGVSQNNGIRGEFKNAFLDFYVSCDGVMILLLLEVTNKCSLPLSHGPPSKRLQLPLYCEELKETVFPTFLNSVCCRS